ncbi:MAG: hypothetical protein MUF10_14475, partial [Thermoanaerobaculaceae bacterium]|nr:hypothetical protein [Thermoanaerobaculaceae bacterium]
ILAAGSVLVGFVGIGKAVTLNVDLNWFEHFLHPVAPGVEIEGAHLGLGVEWLLIALSVGVAVGGILLARRFYFGPKAGETPARLAESMPGLYAAVANKYYVDEIYDATVISGTMRLARGSWELDARVIDGIVNGTALGTRGSSFLSGLFDLHVVDGLVNWVAGAYDWASRRLRRMQWGVVQGYALVMMVGFVLVLAAALWLGRGM